MLYHLSCYFQYGRFIPSLALILSNFTLSLCWDLKIYNYQQFIAVGCGLRNYHFHSSIRFFHNFLRQIVRIFLCSLHAYFLFHQLVSSYWMKQEDIGVLSKIQFQFIATVCFLVSFSPFLQIWNFQDHNFTICKAVCKIVA